jgi:secondary thiamine-phosphate synthase enzyme
LRQASHHLTIATEGRGLVEITGEIVSFLALLGLETGLLTVFCPHTSASLLIQENADADVRADLESWFERAAPEGRGRYKHDTEGPDDMPSHIRAALTQTQISIPIITGKLALGTWQGVYLFEHRRAPQRREVVLHVMGEWAPASAGRDAVGEAR